MKIPRGTKCSLPSRGKKKTFRDFPFDSPSIVTSNAPNANRVDRLCIQNSQIFRIDELQSAFVQIQEQVFALEKGENPRKRAKHERKRLRNGKSD